MSAPYWVWGEGVHPGGKFHRSGWAGWRREVLRTFAEATWARFVEDECSRPAARDYATLAVQEDLPMHLWPVAELASGLAAPESTVI